MSFPASIFVHRSKRSMRRCFIFLLASALLHLMTVRGISGIPAFPHAVTLPPEPVVEVRLLAALPAMVSADVKPLPAEPVARHRSRPVPAASAMPSASLAESAAPAHPAQAVASRSAAIGHAAGLPASDADQATGEAEHAVAPAEPQYRASPPPSADLKYDVKALSKGNMVYGSGRLRWQADGQTYLLEGEASVLPFTALNFRSSGVLDQSGVSPVLYTQKRWRKSATNTHFHRERNLISFSASTQSYPREGGEQDRASIIWQMAAIGRADASQFFPGARFRFFVAGVRDGEHWEIKVAGREEIETSNGSISTWHLVRHPPQGSYDQKLDIWLAPDLGWYPVTLRYTEPDGEYLEMNLSNPEAVAFR